MTTKREESEGITKRTEDIKHYLTVGVGVGGVGAWAWVRRCSCLPRCEILDTWTFNYKSMLPDYVGVTADCSGLSRLACHRCRRPLPVSLNG